MSQRSNSDEFVHVGGTLSHPESPVPHDGESRAKIFENYPDEMLQKHLIFLVQNPWKSHESEKAKKLNLIICLSPTL